MGVSRAATGVRRAGGGEVLEAAGRGAARAFFRAGLAIGGVGVTESVEAEGERAGRRVEGHLAAEDVGEDFEVVELARVESSWGLWILFVLLVGLFARPSRMRGSPGKAIALLRVTKCRRIDGEVGAA